MNEMDTSASGTRRKFLRQLATGSLAAFAMPAMAATMKPQFLPLVGNAADESYWQMVKKQFTVPDNLVMMNAANLCPSPYFISEKVFSLTRELESNVSFQYRAAFAEQRTKAIAQLSQFLDISKEEIGITRNTSESNCTIVNGLDFKAGDEIILWEQNHPSNGMAWEKRAKRGGLIIKKITLPANPSSADELIAPFAKAMTSKTRLIAFSHISNLSGLALPAKEICSLAQSKNVLTLVDGAQSLGMVDLNLRDMGCDFYTASTHKWLMGPLENGILYAKKDHLEKLWPNVIGGGWKDEGHSVDEKLCVLGQRIETTTAALPETLDFHHSIGKKAIEERVRLLNAYLKEQVQAKVPKATFVTPLSSAFSGGIVIINLPGKDPREIYQKLYENYGIAAASTGGIRFSPHIYNVKADIDKVVSGLSELAS